RRSRTVRHVPARRSHVHSPRTARFALGAAVAQLGPIKEELQMKNKLLALVLTGVFGCGAPLLTDANEVNTEAAKPAGGEAAADKRLESEKLAAATGEGTDVPECDALIEKYEACIGKIPAAELDAMKDGWKQTMLGGEAAKACKQADESSAE